MRSMGNRSGVGLVVLIAAVVVVASVSAALRGAGRIAFDDGRTFPSKIGTMNPDGSDVQIISERGDHWPRWSADGEKIVFFSTRAPDGSDNADAEIYVMNPDGSGQTALTDNAIQDQVPTWTRDGRIVWSQRSGRGQWDLWLMNDDGSNKEQLTSFNGAELWPSVAPQGNRIAFAGTHADGRFHIFSIRADGSDARQLTFSSLEDWAPAWSPIGNDIVFTRETPAPTTSAGFDEDLFIIHADGSNLRQVTSDPNRVELFPVWSPSGKSLLYPASTDWMGPNWDGGLFAYDLKTGVETAVGEPNIGGAPSWQPLPSGGGS